MKLLKFLFYELFVSIFFADLLLTNSTIISFLPYIFPGFHKIIALFLVNISLLIIARNSCSWNASYLRMHLIMSSFVLFFSVIIILGLTFLISNLAVKDIIVYFIFAIIPWIILAPINEKANFSYEKINIKFIIVISFAMSIFVFLIFFILKKLDFKNVLHYITHGKNNINGMFYFLYYYIIIFFGAIVPSSFQYSVFLISLKKKNKLLVAVSVIWLILFNIGIWGIA